MKCLAIAALAATGLCPLAHADPVRILFVGNSYTFGRVDPVMRDNAASVHDLTAAFLAADPSGANAFEPHPWGGVSSITVPEPETVPLIGAGIGLMGWTTARRRKSVASVVGRDPVKGRAHP